MKTIDALPIRGEYKLRIWKQYSSAAFLFSLTVHDLALSSLVKLDVTVMKFIRKWLRLPKKASTSLITHRDGMDCRLPSQLYHLGHATVIETALGRDADVDPALRDAVSYAVSDTQVSLSLKHRYTWRHDNILFALRDLYTSTLGPAWDIVIDATRDGNTIVYDQHTSTIPPDILPTTCRPDLAAIDRVQRKIHIMELTCPWDSAESFNNAQERKSDRYGPLIGDLSDIGWEVNFITVEIGVRKGDNSSRYSKTYVQ
ncbi:hypothetical protein BSL78_00196 [Apostichopus japonicus]|uniref:Uncharacterized protein n=1 Tax=Stichopus japonicus TaxID=307972 RepID=A0A2G8LRM1_STIJA|nr:hypothetical protein BSL78_00196 [Apostichopus japonicus]